MAAIGIFVGSAPLKIEDFHPTKINTLTPWGEASCAPMLGNVGAHQVYILPRHGAAHEFAPHQINYRANVWLMHQLAVDHLIGTYTVGAVDPNLAVGALVAPHQIIDYTWGREQTYDDELRHVEFAEPYSTALRRLLCEASPSVVDGGVYGATQGPRLETAAEIVRLARDGCTLVGMTGMPEAALARELELSFAALCLVVNPAAGLGSEEISLETIREVATHGGEAMLQLLHQLIVSHF